MARTQKNTTLYEIFLDHFLPCVIIKSVYDCQVCVATNDRTLCTVSNKAFPLLLLENSFDGWVEIYQLQKGEVTLKQGQKCHESESDIPTKFTKSGII